MAKALLLMSVLVLTIVLFVIIEGSDPCTDVASAFVSKMQKADIGPLIHLFGENSCHCEPRGGYIAYLKYESGENDNLAFLFGHNFKIGAMSAKVVPTIEKVQASHLPWDAPESAEVDIPLFFDKAVYSPYFIPLDTAYGYPVSEANLTKFCQDPSQDFWKALSLRLRPSLATGLVAEAKVDPKRKAEFMADLFKEILPADQAKYLKPADSGAVIGQDGSKKTAESFGSMIPRLKRGVLRLYIGRRGRLQRWAVKKGRLKDPVFELAGGKELALTTPDVALVDVHGPAAEADSPPPARK